MPEVFKHASVLAFPTVPWESFGIVILEAMACGVPVVATNDPIRREIVGDAGILVDPTNTDKYSKSLKDAAAKNWKLKPRLRAEKFSWNKIAIEYNKLIESLRKTK